MEIPREDFEMENLLATIREESNKRKSKRNLLMAIVGVIVATLVTNVVVSIISGGHSHIFLNFGPFIGLIVAMTAMSQKQKDATTALTKYNDVRCVPAFADVLGCKDKRLEMIAEEKLIQILPLMKASDASLLNENQRKNLNQAIEKRGSTVACAILKAYEQVGDGSAIPHVERVKKETNEILRRQAAERCLPFLVQRAETEKLRQTLLRAADGNTQTTEPSMLLRPASSTIETQFETLLRSSQTEDDANVAATTGTTDQPTNLNEYAEYNAKSELQTASVGTKPD